MQGVLFQGGLAVMLVVMALLSRDEPKFFAAYLWSLVAPAGIAYVFLNAHKRTLALPPESAREGEKAETKRAFSAIGGVIVLWVVGLAVIALLL